MELSADALRLVVVKVRPGGVDILAAHTVADYSRRPAAEWGNEYSAFLRQHGVAHLTAAVLLPRRDLIVRVVNLPGVQPLALLGVGSAVVNPGLDLTGIGMAGCRAYTNLDLGLFGPVVGTASAVTFPFPIPASPSLNGATLSTQGVGFSNFTALGLSATNGVRLVIAL